MTLLPIVERELRVAARRRATYWTRSAIVLLATIVGIGTFAASTVIPTTKFGELLFWGLSGISMSYCLVAGRQLTADCLSEEKREGTFGLLFLTDLKGYDVVLGKLFARSFNGFYGLMATVPVLAIPLLVGGMTYGEFWRMVVVLVDTFLFTLAVGMFVSAISRDYQHAMGRNFAVLLLTTSLLPACAMLLFALHPSKPPMAELMLPCPLYAFVLASDAMYTKTPLLFWSSAGLIHGTTWALIVSACLLAPRSWQDKPVPPRSVAGPKRRHWRWGREGSVAQRDAFRKRLLNQNAYYWLAGRPYVKPAWVWTLLALVALWMVRTSLAVGHFEETVCIGAALLVNSTLKLWIASEGCQQLSTDQKSGAFELLLSTPLTVDEIVRGQLLALARQFLKPLLTVIGAELIFMLALTLRAYHPGEPAEQLVWMWMAGIIMLAADAAALSVFAMVSALTAKSFTQASMRTVRYILVLPWVLYGMAYLFTDLIFEWRPNWGSSLSWKYELAVWFALGIGVDLLFGLSAWHRLRTDFRVMALRAFGPPPVGFLERWRRRFRAIRDAVWPQPNIAGDPSSRVRRKKILIVGAALFVCVGLLLTRFFFNERTAKPLDVFVGTTNTTLRVLFVQDGLLFILPDGTLWRWGAMTGTPRLARAAAPQQVGANADWVEVYSCNDHTIGLRANGTVWQWDPNHDKPQQVDPGQDWAHVSGGFNFSVILKRDGTLWAWGNNNFGQLGNGLGPSPRKITQIGTNADWKAIGSLGQGTMGLRKDGTLWVWGNIEIVSGPLLTANAVYINMSNFPYPIQVCRETNWESVSAARPGVLRDTAGRFWNVQFLKTAPSAAAPVTAVLDRIESRSICFPAFGADQTRRRPMLYEVRSDGALWAAPMRWPSTLTAAQEWKQIGKRRDWISVWGNFESVVALTADGTIWAWGNDWGHEPTPHFQSGFQAFVQRVGHIFGGPFPGNPSWMVYPVQKEPKPLMRLVPGASGQTNGPAR